MRMTEKEYEELKKRGMVRENGSSRITVQPQEANTPSEAKSGGKGPNKTEASYMNLLAFEFPGCKISFEGISLRLDNGARYTPDVAVHTPEGLLLVEVKNAAYKHASYGRSKMAFNQCRLDYPQFQYRWAEKDKNTWNVK